MSPTGPSTRKVSEANGGGGANGESLAPMISTDGRQVAFTSPAWNLVGDDFPAGNQHVYARPMPGRATS